MLRFYQKNGGEQFLKSFARTLSTEHCQILFRTMMDYHYSSIREVSLEFKANDHYATKARTLIEKKLEKCRKKRELIESLIEIVGDSALDEFAEKLSEKENKIMIEYTLNPVFVKISDYAQVSGENQQYVSKVNSRLTEKLQALAKLYD